MLRAVFGQRGNHGDVVYVQNDGSRLTIRGAIEAHLNWVGTPGGLIAGRWTQTMVTRHLRTHWECEGGKRHDHKAHNVYGDGCTNLFVISEGVLGAGAGAGARGAAGLISQEQARCLNPPAAGSCSPLALACGLVAARVWRGWLRSKRPFKRRCCGCWRTPTTMKLRQRWPSSPPRCSSAMPRAASRRRRQVVSSPAVNDPGCLLRMGRAAHRGARR